jgi:hypothetical protein
MYMRGNNGQKYGNVSHLQCTFNFYLGFYYREKPEDPWQQSAQISSWTTIFYNPLWKEDEIHLITMHDGNKPARILAQYR